MAEEKEPEQIDAYMGTMELYQKIYDFLLYIYPILAQFPKFEKFALQTQIKTAIFEMLKDVIRFKKTGTKSSFCQRKWKRVHKNDERNRNENTMCTRIFWMSGL